MDRSSKDTAHLPPSQREGHETTTPLACTGCLNPTKQVIPVRDHVHNQSTVSRNWGPGHSKSPRYARQPMACSCSIKARRCSVVKAATSTAEGMSWRRGVIGGGASARAAGLFARTARAGLDSSIQLPTSSRALVAYSCPRTAAAESHRRHSCSAR